jgi:hypothetical protein
MVIGCVAASWPFFEKGNQIFYHGMYLLYAFYAFNSAIFMVIALMKIRSFLKEKGMGEKLSPLKMLIHAIAFWLYIFVYFGLEFIGYLFGDGIKEVFLVHWVVCTIVGFISYFCLFLVLWDLGSLEQRKEFADFKSETTGKTTLQGDSILRLVANEKASFIEVEDNLTDLKS